MDANLHQQQGVNHLQKVLAYAPMVAADGEATVHLTYEDWHVVADTLFRMETPASLLPEAVQEYRLADDHRTIVLDTADLKISIEMF